MSNNEVINGIADEVIEQAKKNPNLGKALKIIFLTVFSVIVILALFAFVGAELGYEPSIALKNIIVEKTAVILTGTTLVILGAAWRVFTYLTCSNRTLNTSVNKATNALKAAHAETTAQLKVATEKLEIAANRLEAATAKNEALNKEVKKLRSENADMQSNQALSLELICSFMDVTANNQKIKDTITKFRTNKLLKQIELPKEINDFIQEAEIKDIKPLEILTNVASAPIGEIIASAKEKAAPVISAVREAVKVIRK